MFLLLTPVNRPGGVRSLRVNTEHILTYRPSAGGGTVIELSDGASLSVANEPQEIDEKVGWVKVEYR